MYGYEKPSKVSRHNTQFIIGTNNFMRSKYGHGLEVEKGKAEKCSRDRLLSYIIVNLNAKNDKNKNKTITLKHTMTRRHIRDNIFSIHAQCTNT